jgi:hypothetical protein
MDTKKLKLRRLETARRELVRIHSLQSSPEAQARMTDAERKRLMALEDRAAFRYQHFQVDYERERERRR